MMAALLAGSHFTRLYSNGARQGVVRSDRSSRSGRSPPRSGHPRPGAPIAQPTSLTPATPSKSKPPFVPGSSPSATSASPSSCPRASPRAICACWFPTAPRSTARLLQPRLSASPADLSTVLAEARNQHAADRIYVSLLAPETQGEINGQTLTSLPLSVANALEPLRNTQNAGLNGESAEPVARSSAGGVLTGFRILNLTYRARRFKLDQRNNA